MKRVLIIYGSTTGNTEYVANHIGDYLIGKGIDVDSRDVAQTQVSDVVSTDTPIMLGCSSWGEDEIGLQEDFDLFHSHLADTDLSGKTFVLFGCGDSSYKHFCGAVDKIGQTIKKNGAHLLGSPLKIDGEPEASIDQINGWLDGLVTML